jgi:hypothetical protein
MDISNERWNLLWSVQRSVRYHARRQGFYDHWRKVTAFISVLAASAGATDLLNSWSRPFAIACMFLVATAAAFDLVVGTSEMARKHDQLRRRFLVLEAAIKPELVTSELELDQWCKERLAIELDEPPTFVVLDLLCENELSVSKGDGPRFRIPWLRRVTAKWLRHEDVAPDDFRIQPRSTDPSPA